METTSIEFKSKCLEPVNLFGYMKGSVTINGDILEPIDEKWFADIEHSF